MANPVTQIILSAVDRTKAAFASVKGGFTSLRESAGSFNGLLAGLGAGLSLVRLVGAIRTAADAMDDARKSAQAAGTSVEKFSALTYAAGQSDVGPDVLQKTLAKLSGSLNDARDSSTKAAESWRNLGIDPQQFTDPADALLVLADRFAAMPDGIKKTALAIELFGEKLGPKLIPFLNLGAAGVRKLTDDARDLGKVIGDEASAAAEQFNDSLDRLKASSGGLGISIASKLIPSLNQYISALDEITRKGSVLENIAFFTTGFISEDVLNRITKAGDRVQDYNLEIGKLQQQLLELRRVELADSPNIKLWEERIAALDKTRAQLIERAKQERAEAAKNSAADDRETKDSTAAFKAATTERIRDAERLKSALQSAFSQSLSAERDYLRQAKKLRAEADGGGTVGSDPESQARARLDATIAAMKLQREAGTANLETVQDQAEALRQMADQIEDVRIKENLRRQANLAEAGALEKAARDEAERARQQAEHMRELERTSANMQAALAGIGKEVSVDIKPGPQTDETLGKLRETRELIEFINSTPVKVTAKTGGDLSTGLREEALKYGRRG